MVQGYKDCTSDNIDVSSRHNITWSIKVCKVVTILVLFLLMTCALIVNKVSMVWLVGGTLFDNKSPETWYAAIGLVLIFPEVFALIKVFWHTSFIKRTRTHQWPSGLAIFVGCMVSFAEASCYVVFTLEVAPRLPVQVLLPLLSAVYTVSLSHEQLEHMKENISHSHGSAQMAYDVNFTLAQKKSVSTDGVHECQVEEGVQNWKRVLRTIFGFSGIWTSCAIAGIVALTAPLPWFQALCLPACVCILSLCWHPRVQVYIFRSSDGTFLGRWKATCGYTIMKIFVMIVGLSIVMMIRLKENTVIDSVFFTKMRNGLLTCNNEQIMYLLVAHFISSFCVHIFGYVAATLSIAFCGVTLPSMVATPASVGLVIWMCNAGYTLFSLITCFQGGIGIWCACGLAGITWLAPYLIRGTDLNKNSEIVLKPFVELFIQPTWNSIFVDQHMSLNYKHDGFSSTDHILKEEENPMTRVFICTTMYREADFEMGRLLKSINKVATSKRLEKVYMESHIFLDNGTTDLHFNEFASQLVSLLEKNLSVTARQANAYETPYGVQLNWTLPGGMPFFLHLKDSAKVKAKKRWSQVMYMSYVLNFRVLQDHSQQKMTNLLAEQNNIDDSIFVGYASDTEWKKNTVKLKSAHGIKQFGSSLAVTPPALGCQTPYYLRENRKHLKQIFYGSHDPAIVSSTTALDQTSETIDGDVSSPYSACITPLGIHISTPGSSSDQGIGYSTSDDQYEPMSDTSAKQEEVDSSPSFFLKRAMKDESGNEYEGDVSSNNENSLTSAVAEQFTHSAKSAIKRDSSILIHPVFHCSEERDKSTRTQSLRRFTNGAKELMRLDSATSKLSHPAFYNTEGRSRHKSLQTHHPRHISPRKSHHKPRRDQSGRGQSAKCVPLQEQESSDSGAGHDNAAFEESSYPSSRSLRSKPKLNEERSTTKSTNLCESNVYVVSNNTPDTQGEVEIPLDDHTYILATDADMEFTDDSVADLLNTCHFDRRVGGACGRTHPIGQRNGPLVWYQKFEYAKDFWMIKSAQNIIGSVMCCPGCFSLYRAGAVRDVLGYYAGPTSVPFDVFIKDTGEDRWMCTLMMLKGWKLEYTAFCDNATYCPSSFEEFMKQRRRWVLSDITNMLLVFKNIFKLAQRNDSFSIAYILYMVQMFVIVILSPASTIIILAGGLNLAFGLPFEVMVPSLGVIILTYALICLVCSLTVQVRCTLFLTLAMGIAMISVVIGGSFYVFQDMTLEYRSGNFTFQQYYLILLLIAALIFAALIHPKECWILAHGASYMLGFPAIQILLPVYAVCNIVDQSWGTRDKNKSTNTPTSCFSKNRKKYHKTLTEKCRQEGKAEPTDENDDAAEEVICPESQFKDMEDSHQLEEFVFWRRMHELILSQKTNLGVSGPKLAGGLRTLRIICLLALVILNTLWLVLLSVLFFSRDVYIARMNVYGLIAGAVYGLVLLIQMVGMTVHRLQAIFTKFGLKVFGQDKPVWIYTRTST